VVLDPARERPRRRRGLWWILGLLLFVLLLILLLRGCGDDDDNGSGAGGATTEQTDGGSGDTGDTGGDSGDAEGGAGSLTSDGQNVFAEILGGPGALEGLLGKDAEGTSVTVQEVVNEDGFWVGTSEEDRVFVEIEDDGAASIDVAKGDTVSFTGVIEQNIEAETYGLREEQGAQQFRDQGAHVQVQAGDLKQG